MKRTVYLRSRKILAFTWVGCFIVAILIGMFIYSKEWIDDPALIRFLKEISKIYLPFVGAILGYFLQRRIKIAGSAVSESTGLLLAFIFSLLWNLLILFFLVPLAFKIGNFNKAMSNIDSVAEIFSWLVAGSIGYFFATEKSVPG